MKKLDLNVYCIYQTCGDNMVLMLDGNSEIGAHVLISVVLSVSDIWLDREQSQKTYFLYACTACSEIPSNISTLVGSKTVPLAYMVLIMVYL